MLVAHGCVARSARGRSTATLASVARRQPRAMSGQKAATMCGRALRGLFAGRSIRFGNNVSEGGGNKTRRSWKPNAMRKRVFSDLLGRMVPIYLTAHALRCIDKAGGLDNYILNARPQELGTGVGPQLLHELTLAREASRGRAQAPGRGQTQPQ